MKSFDQTLIDLGAKLTAARKAKHLSLRTLAEKSETSYSGLSRLESGKEPNPSIMRLYKICSALEIDIKDIL